MPKGTLTYGKEITAVLVVDPYNDFISEGGKRWDRLQSVAEANHCVPHMLQVLNAARAAKLRIFYALHHRYRPGDYETWKYIARCAGSQYSQLRQCYREHSLLSTAKKSLAQH